MANSKQINGLDFTGQVFFIGIDVHKKNWSVTIGTNNLVIKTFSMNPSPLEFAKYMRNNYLDG